MSYVVYVRLKLLANEYAGIKAIYPFPIDSTNEKDDTLLFEQLVK
jgi:hypothetical protein